MYVRHVKLLVYLMFSITFPDTSVLTAIQMCCKCPKDEIISKSKNVDYVSCAKGNVTD